MRKLMIRRSTIIIILILQLIPLVLFPADSFTLTSQEWWLPVLLAVMVVFAVVRLLRGTISLWPWYLLSFSQGFNIISRLMMLMPHATVYVDNAQKLNTPYVVLSLLSMLLSAFMLWYTEWPEVRLGLVPEQKLA